MADERRPAEGETRKAWLHRVYGIGKGAGRGRISAEGHEKLAWAATKGYKFADTEVAAVAPKKAPTKPAKPAAVAKVVIPNDRRAEVGAVDPAAIREWAGTVGIPISARGRISAETTLRYLDEVPAHEREARANNGKDLRQAAPRVHPVGTTWRADFTNHRGEKETVMLSDKTACGNCRHSLGWCGCTAPRVTVGYERGPVRLTTVYPNGE